MSGLNRLIPKLFFTIFSSMAFAHEGSAHLHPHGTESVILFGIVVVTVASLLIWQWKKH